LTPAGGPAHGSEMLHRIDQRGPVRRDGRPFSVGIVARAEEIANLEESLANGWASPYGPTEPVPEREAKAEPKERRK